jgi:hypothetical protein
MLLDLIALDNSAKVWIYQNETKLSDSQVEGIKSDLWTFLDRWTSHHNKLYAYGNVFHELFIVFFVDQRWAEASGCSIDKSVHFMEELEQKYSLNLFNRNKVAYMEKAEDEDGEDISKIHISDLEELKSLYQQNIIGDDTFVFDNLVQTKAQFLSRWVVPIKESWHRKYL